MPSSPSLVRFCPGVFLQCVRRHKVSRAGRAVEGSSAWGILVQDSPGQAAKAITTWYNSGRGKASQHCSWGT